MKTADELREGCRHHAETWCPGCVLMLQAEARVAGAEEMRERAAQVTEGELVNISLEGARFNLATGVMSEVLRIRAELAEKVRALPVVPAAGTEKP
jgi:hypothetical protein